MAEPLDGVTILVVDDEPQIRRVLRNALSAAGADIVEAENGQQALDQAVASRPGLVILDLGLPDQSGLAVCRDLRQWSAIPIIVLSARHSDSDKVSLLDAGADDYMAKPFSTNELLARVRAQLRRSGAAAANVGASIKVEDLEVDLQRRNVKRGGNDVHLTPTEWDLLRTLIKNAGRTLTHQQIFREVWRNPGGDAQAYLRVHLANLRRKIETDPLRPTLIITEPGVGYRFKAID